MTATIQYWAFARSSKGKGFDLFLATAGKGIAGHGPVAATFGSQKAVEAECLRRNVLIANQRKAV